jgi:hypothetical protein
VAALEVGSTQALAGPTRTVSRKATTEVTPALVPRRVVLAQVLPVQAQVVPEAILL